MKRLGAYFIYIVECADGTYYTGSTNHLERRLRLHNSGNGAKYVRGRTPVRLVYKKRYRSFGSALRAEIKLKSLPRGKKIEMIETRNRSHGHVT